jgi:AcrR family transcriptional regulator
MSSILSARRPAQKRSQATYDRLLDSAGELLEELGVERISTNLIAARAGVSPPTLYHYFPDKYALLAALGERLMVAQNALVPLDPTLNEAAIAEILLAHVDLTRASPGGAWVMRMLRAVPQLAAVRLASHRQLAIAMTDIALARDPSQSRSLLECRTRLVVDLGFTAIELAFDEPDLDERAIMAQAARAIRLLLD